MLKSAKVTCSAERVTPSFACIGETNRAHTYCGLDAAIIAIMASASCHQRATGLGSSCCKMVALIRSSPKENRLVLSRHFCPRLLSWIADTTTRFAGSHAPFATVSRFLDFSQAFRSPRVFRTGLSDFRHSTTSRHKDDAQPLPGLETPVGRIAR